MITDSLTRFPVKKGAKHGRQPLRILCADDNVHVVAMLAETLRMHGYCVETAFDGQHALTAITEKPDHFDVLITDFRMPRLDGYGLVKELRPAGYRGKVIIFASPLSDENKQRLRDLSVDAIVEKPGRQKELIGLIKKIQDELWSQSNASAA